MRIVLKSAAVEEEVNGKSGNVMRSQTFGIDHLVLGFDARDPRLPHLLQVFRPHEYRSHLYASPATVVSYAQIVLKPTVRPCRSMRMIQFFSARSRSNFRVLLAKSAAIIWAGSALSATRRARPVRSEIAAVNA